MVDNSVTDLTFQAGHLTYSYQIDSGLLIFSVFLLKNDF